MTDFNYDNLDPGIRDTVRCLRDAGFVTTDSGDGSKYGFMQGALPFPHVVVRLNESNAFSETRRLAALMPEWHVEMSWSPGEPVIAAVSKPNEAKASLIQQFLAEPDRELTNAELIEMLNKYGCPE